MMPTPHLHDSQYYREHCLEPRSFAGPGNLRVNAGISNIELSLKVDEKVVVVWINPLGLGGPEHEMLSLSAAGLTDAIRGAQDLVDRKLDNGPRLPPSQT